MGRKIAIVGSARIPFQRAYTGYADESNLTMLGTTLAGLADLLRSDPPAVVIPGHGGPLEPEVALEIAEQDLGYLHALRDAVAQQLAAGADRESTLEAAIAVPTPRSAPVDLAESRRNAERQFEELVVC